MRLEPEISRCRRLVLHLQQQLDSLRIELAREQERLVLLERLNGLDAAPHRPTPDGTAGGRALEDAVVRYLATSAKPLHISKLRHQLVHDGIPIPGKGTDANVIARIMRDSRISRAPGQRGFYRLAAPENESIGGHAE